MGKILADGTDSDSGLHVNSRAYKQTQALGTFKQWYLMLCRQLAADPDNERIHGQVTMLSSVLFMLLPEKEYKGLTTDENLSDAESLTLV